ncbi:hypothetical protein N9132_01630, partial [bacterium]|nr:hypothetical protein [bacterium]
GQNSIKSGRSFLEFSIIECLELLTASREMPVGSCFPKSLRRSSHKGGVEVGEPIEAGLELGRSDGSETRGISGGIEIFEDEEDFIIVLIKGKEFGNSAIQIAALVPMAIPSSLDLIGFELPLVGEIRVPAPGMIPRRSHPDMLGNDRGRGPSLRIDAKDLSVAAPEFLYHLSDFYCRSAGGGADRGLEGWV